jgi:putative peptidoglycan lipid II flippase
VLWWSAGDDRFWITAGLWPKLSRLSLVIVAGAAAYFATLWLVGFRFAHFNRRESP